MRARTRVLLWMAAFVACALVARKLSVNAGSGDLDEFVQTTMASWQVPGLSLAVARGGQVLKHTAYGRTAPEESATRVEPSMRFPVLSVTKSFTATAVMRLVEDGRLTLDAQIGDLLPTTPPEWHRVTVRQCLSHTSGIRSFNDLPGFFEKVEPLNPTAPELIRFASGAPVQFQPGERFAYNNTGYLLLQLVIESVGGITYERFVEQRVLAPAGPSASGFIPRHMPLERRSHGYSTKWGRIIATPASNIQTLAIGAAGLEATSGDLVGWVSALASGRIVTTTSTNVMWSPATLQDGRPVTNYGLGWWLGEVEGRRQVSAIGGPAVGFYTSVSYFPDDQLAVAVVTNSDTRGGQIVAREVAARYLRGAPTR